MSRRRTEREILAMIERGEMESLVLEMTGGPFDDTGFKAKLRKTISAFANSIGGELICGISTQKDNRETSRANGIKPVADVDAQVELIYQWLTGLVAPRVPGIDVYAVPLSGKFDNSGFVCISVPESDSGPHMANEDRRYFKRHGRESQPMEHFEVADAFGRRRRPDLEFVARIQRQNPMFTSMDTQLRCEIIVGLHNRGRGMAKFPLLALLSPILVPAEYGLNGNGNRALFVRPRPSTSKWTILYEGGPGHVIHPGMILDVDMLVFKGAARELIDGTLIEYEVAAEDMAVKEGSWRLDRTNLL